MTSLIPNVKSMSENAILTFQIFVFDSRSGRMGTANHKNLNL